MTDLNPVSGIIKAATTGFETAAGVFTSNKENDAQRSADEQMALMKAYQAEFNAKSNRNWFDSVADGFNRLIRPFIVLLILSVFIIAYISPKHLAEISLAMSSIPQGYWTLLSIIIAFYFGGRMQLKSQQFKFNESQAVAVKALIEAKKEFRNLEMDTDEPDRIHGEENGKNPQLDMQRNQQQNEVVALALKQTQEDSLATLKEKVKQMRDESPESVSKRRRFARHHSKLR